MVTHELLKLKDATDHYDVLYYIDVPRTENIY